MGIHNHPLPIATHPSPLTTQLAHSAPRILTTVSLPLTASLNFCTKGTRVWFFSFQKFAMWLRAKKSMAALATLQLNNAVGELPYDVVASTMGVRKETNN
jgi:hypothetical protein